MSFLLLNRREARSLSAELRTNKNQFMRLRRAIFSLYLGASASLGVISLFQMGIVKRLPDPDFPNFDADRVNSSPEAYSILSAPDGALAVASYAGTLALVGMGTPDRAERYPVLPLAMAAKIGVDVLNATRLAVDEWKKHRSFCSWCLLAVTATLAAAPLALPEGRAAWQQFIKQHR